MWVPMRRTVVILLAVALAGLAVSAQAPLRPAGARFDAVSIKSNRSATGGSIGAQPGGRFVMINLPMARLIRVAYPALTSQLIGAPAWVNSERYDVIAKAEGDPTSAQIEAMLRALLADRLKLVAHFEPREQEVYALVVARADRRLGPRLTAAPLDCAAQVEVRPGSGLSLPPRPNGAPPCGLSSDGRRLTSGGLTMAQLARNISPLAGRVVIDNTGLAGFYEFTLEYAARAGNAAGIPESGDDRPSIFAALQEQLGLELEPLRAPVDVLVIDRIDRPSED